MPSQRTLPQLVERSDLLASIIQANPESLMAFKELRRIYLDTKGNSNYSPEAQAQIKLAYVVGLNAVFISIEAMYQEEM